MNFKDKQKIQDFCFSMIDQLMGLEVETLEQLQYQLGGLSVLYSFYTAFRHLFGKEYGATMEKTIELLKQSGVQVSDVGNTQSN